VGRQPLNAKSSGLFRTQINDALDYVEGLVGGIVGVTDGDKGDITVSGSGTVWNIDAGAVGATELAASAVETAKINDGAVTFAKLDGAAVITSGETIAANDSDTAVPTAAAVIDYADSVGMVPLDEQTAAADATLDFTAFNNAVYSRYRFVLENVKPATDAVGLYVRVSTDGGSTYDSGASTYAYAGLAFASGGTGSFGSTTGTFIQIVNTNDMGNAATEFGYTGIVDVYHAADGATQTRIIAAGAYDNTSGAPVGANANGRRLAAQDTDGLRFLFSSGNIASGTIKMYGIV
jgi:hypothetical protein